MIRTLKSARYYLHRTLAHERRAWEAHNRENGGSCLSSCEVQLRWCFVHELLTTAIVALGGRLTWRERDR